MASDLKKSIKKGKIIVLVIPNEEYTKKILDIAKHFSTTHKATCYVSLNKLFNSLNTSLKEAKIKQDRFLFIDAITKSANPNAKAADNCLFVSSSSALTEMSISIGKCLGTGKFDGFLFDSLSTLLIYNKGETVCKFVHDLINKIKKSGTTAVFTALEGDTKSALLKDISMFVDEIVHLK